MAKMPLPPVLLRFVARQLGGPSGPFGKVVATALNKANGRAMEAAVQALDLHGGETVADIGYGGGLGLELLLTAVGETGRVHGVEPSASMDARARKHYADAVTAGRLELHEATMDALPFGVGTIDGLISLNTIYFIEDLDAAFRELARVLAPSGTAVIGIADPDWMRDNLPFTQHGFRLRPVDDVVAQLSAAGLTAERRKVTASDAPGAPAPFNLLVCRRG